MNSPKVTLLLEAWCDYTLVAGKRRFVFTGGVPREVSPAVAILLSKRKDSRGNPLFKIEDLPTIVIPVQSTPTIAPIEPVAHNAVPVKQNDLGWFIQESLLACLS
jgi:hypothetical protein